MKINLIANLNGSLIGLSFTAETEITIGRENGNTIAPLAADGLSRKHARIFFKDGKWMLEDLGSMNGTYRQGAKVEAPVELAVRDMLQFGKLEISVDEIGDAKAPEAPAAAPAAPAPAPAPAPAAPTPAPAPAPAAPAPAAPAPAKSPAAPTVLRRPTLPGLKPGLKPGMKLPPKPTLGAGLKLPPKPTLGAGLKLPPKKPTLSAPPKSAGSDVVMTPVE